MKTVGVPQRSPLNKWVNRPQRTVACVALSSACTPSNAASAMRTTTLNAIGSMVVKGSDVQNSAQGVTLYSAGADNFPGSWSVTPDNFKRSMVVFAVRKAVKKTWLNDRDQFTAPIGVGL